MAMTPKKKYEYFDGGRGISDLTLGDATAEHSDNNSNNSSSSSNSPHPNPYHNASHSGGSTRHSSPFQGPPSPLIDYPLNAMSPHLPYAAQSLYHPTPYQEYAQGVTLGNPYATHGAAVSPSSSTSSYGGAAYSRYVPTEAQRGGYGVGDPLNGELPPTYAVEDEDEDPHKAPKGSHHRGQSQAKSQKRPQRCRMCANHGNIVDMKGHKWYCPHRECPCNDCDITRKTQYYMKERQKLTRHQQQLQHGDLKIQAGASGPGTPEAVGGRKAAPSDHNQIDFPREEEMVSQTRNILDYDLFDKVNRACSRPRSSTNILQ